MLSAGERGGERSSCIRPDTMVQTSRVQRWESGRPSSLLMSPIIACSSAQRMHCSGQEERAGARATITTAQKSYTSSHQTRTWSQGSSIDVSCHPMLIKRVHVGVDGKGQGLPAGLSTGSSASERPRKDDPAGPGASNLLASKMRRWGKSDKLLVRVLC
jgi:hypothetical protein